MSPIRYFDCRPAGIVEQFRPRVSSRLVAGFESGRRALYFDIDHDRAWRGALKVMPPTLRARLPEPRAITAKRYSHPRLPNAERSTPGGAYHPAEP